ncbi:MAG: GCN5-related N-acetyltransferase [Labilithrix sp.]|nr:GCN5-related N-acetyltransferase [Labilithrix sp.]
MILRPVEERDLEALFAHQSDPEGAAMAAFPSRDREAFFAHWRTRVLADPSGTKMAIEDGGEVVGNVLAWTADGQRKIGYWIDRACWGRGVASRALAELVARIETARPLHAEVVKTNLASIRVLEKCGFVRVGEHEDEILMRLDEAPRA